ALARAQVGIFPEATTLLESVGAAVVVRDAAELARELRRLLADPDLRAKMGDLGYGAIVSGQGAVRGGGGTRRSCGARAPSGRRSSSSTAIFGRGRARDLP